MGEPMNVCNENYDRWIVALSVLLVNFTLSLILGVLVMLIIAPLGGNAGFWECTAGCVWFVFILRFAAGGRISDRAMR